MTTTDGRTDQPAPGSTLSRATGPRFRVDDVGGLVEVTVRNGTGVRVMRGAEADVLERLHRDQGSDSEILAVFGQVPRPPPPDPTPAPGDPRRAVRDGDEITR